MSEVEGSVADLSAVEPRSPLSVAAVPAHPMIAELPSALVDVAARRGRGEDLAAALSAEFGLALPPPGRFAEGRDATAVWIRPDTWLVIAPRGPEGALARRLAQAAGAAGSVVDQSHGKTRVRLAGRHARRVLGKGCRLDLDPAAFGPGQAAITQMAQVSALLLQRDDTPAYELVVGSSYAVPFLEWLTESAAEFAGTL
ncbi:sarcosine oxidase subunit gamma [Stella sp.]|uniref:sarcosine oxidase subunit gamma n=1 Tax=Stella sp. TaxID=2912054 RepID=UPI0035B089A4